MSFHFKIIPNDDLAIIIPLVFELNESKISMDVLKSRVDEMKTQNYECVGLFNNQELIGVSGMWFCTRHYMGKSMELDHVYIQPKYRNEGLGQKFMAWIKTYAESQGCKSIELNTYVQNYSSHKFYYREGYEIWGYHFLKLL